MPKSVEREPVAGSLVPLRGVHLACEGDVTRVGLRDPGQEGRSVDDFDIAQSKIGESAQRVVDRAVEESRSAAPWRSRYR